MRILTDLQLQFITGILSDIGQIFFASLVIPFFVSLKSEFVLSGLTLAIGFWLLGLIISKSINL